MGLMVDTKRCPVREALALCFVFLAGASFLAAQPEPQPQPPLASLLSGSSTDLAGTVSTLSDADLPLALAVADALKFKALHGESNLPLREIEDFHQALSKRLEAGQKVSMTKTSACPVAIPFRKVTLAGLELTVPAHFVPEQSLDITEVSPQGEAGTLFPEIRVSFLTDKPPVKATLTLDGRVLTPVKHNPGFVAFRPGLSLENLVLIGTHTATVFLTDAASRQVSRSWSFSIGSRPVPNPDASATAELVATLTMGLNQVVAGAPPGFSLTVLVRENPDGQRFFEYVIGDGTPSGSSFMRTTSLLWVHRLGKCRGGEEFLVLLPKTSLIFPGNLVKFVGSYRGPGQVLEMNWTIIGWGIPTTIVDGPTATARPQAGVSGVFKVKVSDTWPDGTPNTMMLSKQKGVGSFEITCQNDQRSKVFTETGTGTLKLAGRRTCYLSETPSELVEGTTLPVEGGGTLIVITSRWKIVAGTASATIENIQATSTRLLFTAPGFIEVVHDLALSYTCEDEEYSWQYDPLNSIRPYPGSGLFGCFLVKGNVVTEKWPPGIIQGTARKVALRQFSVQINEEKRTFTAPDQMILSPPWVLARSTLFPASYPLELTQVMPVLTARFGPPSSPVTYAYFRDSFETTLTYPADKPFVSEVPCQFGVYPSNWKGLGVFPPIGDILGLPAYRSPADLVEIAIDPLEPIVYEGQKCEFTGRIVPKDGLGEGEISEQADSLDLLDGYLSQGLGSVEWNATLLPQETPLKNGSSLRFDFEPQQGTGTYAVVASTVVSLKEKDTDSVAKAAGISSNTVVVKPGFKILTPFDRFAYSVGMPIKVTTNRDDDAAAWQSIVWSVNGKPWKPEEQAAPAFLTPDKEGDWTIAGTLTIQDESGQDIALRDQVKFSVKSVSTQMDPTRKVVSPPPKTVPLTLGVKLGDVPISKLDQVVDWASGSMKAKVESIDWEAFSSSTTEKPLTVNNPPLAAEVDLDKEGPLTILATVTVRFWSTDPEKPFDQKFSFPPARADLWAVDKPEWDANPEWKLPTKAIASAKRTFTISGVHFKLGPGRPIYWKPQAGFDPALDIPPAMPGVAHLTANTIALSWVAPGNAPESGILYQPFLKDPGPTEVRLAATLLFTPSGSLPFPELVFPLEVENLPDLVRPFVDPASFVISPGLSRSLEFGIEAKEAPSTSDPVKEILVQGGNFKVEIQSVRWKAGTTNLGEGNPIDYKPSKREPVLVVAQGQIKATENDVTPAAPPSLHEVTANSKGRIVRLITYPGEGFVFPASYPITLQVDPEWPSPEKVEWSVDGASVGNGPDVQIKGLPAGRHTIKASQSGSGTEQRSITVFPWFFSMTPDRQAIAWPGSKISLPVWLNTEIDGQPIASGTEIPVGKAKVTVTAVEIFTKADPEAATLSEFSKGVATCTFSGPCAFAASASGTFTVTQPSGLEEPYSFPKPNVLLGAVQAKAEYSFAFEPVRALVDMTRQFKIGSVTVTIKNHSPVVVEDEIPATFTTPIEAVKPLLPGQTPIMALGFDQWAGYAAGNERKQEGPAGLTLEVYFQGPKTRKIYWLPRVRTNSNWGIFLPEVSKRIKPQGLGEIIKAKIDITPPIAKVNEPATVNYLFGLLSVQVTTQGTLYDPSEEAKDHYAITLKKVAWSLASSPQTLPNSPLPETQPSFPFSRGWPGKFEFAGEGVFDIFPSEIDISCSGSVRATNSTLEIQGDLQSLEVIPEKPDHLEGIATVTGPLETDWHRYYDKNGHWVWRSKNGKIETQPLVVAISSSITLLPRISKRPEIFSYLWLHENSPVLQGDTHLSVDGFEISTPEKIGCYDLVLTAPDSAHNFVISSVFAVQKIDPTSNFSKVYFDRCIADSTNALEGKTTSTSIKEMLDSFYDWWWNKQTDYKYYIDAANTSQVISMRGGMCRALGNYFYKALEAQGLPGETSQTLPRLKRLGYNLLPDNPVGKQALKYDKARLMARFRGRKEEELPYSPVSPEFWGGILVGDPGLNQSDVASEFPLETSQNAYVSTPIRLQGKNHKKIPPPDLSSALFPAEEDLVSANTKAYVFHIGKSPDGVLYSDGHAFVILEDGNRFLLYDPSFGKNRFRGFDIGHFEIPNNPSDLSFRLTIIPPGGEILQPLFWTYLKESVLFWRSATYCNLSKMTLFRPWKRNPPATIPLRAGSGLRLIDARSDEVNYLRLLLITYVSNED